MKPRPKRILQSAILLALFLTAGIVKQASSADLPEGWTTSWSDATSRAKAEFKPILAVFSAEWCGPCQMMKAEVFPKPAVKTALQSWIPVYIDERADPATTRKFSITGFPTFVLLSSDAREQFRFVGARPEKAFLDVLASFRKIEDVKSRLKDAPEDPDLWKQLAEAHAARDEDKDAIAAYEKAVYYDPADKTGAADDLYLLKSIPDDAAGLKDAQTKLDAFEAKFPKSDLLDKVHFYRALIAADLREFQKSASILEDALARFPQSQYADSMRAVLDQIKAELGA